MSQNTVQSFTIKRSLSSSSRLYPETQLFYLLEDFGKDAVIKICRGLANDFPETEKVDRNYVLLLSDAYALISRRLELVDMAKYDQICSSIEECKERLNTAYDEALKHVLLLIDTLKEIADLGRSSPIQNWISTIFPSNDSSLTDFYLGELPGVLKHRWKLNPQTPLHHNDFQELIETRIPQDIQTLSYILDTHVFFAMSGERLFGWRIHEGKAEAWLTSKEELLEIMKSTTSAVATLVDLSKQLLLLNKQKQTTNCDLHEKIGDALRLNINMQLYPYLTADTIVDHLTQRFKDEVQE